jgi:hypothetical protein
MASVPYSLPTVLAERWQARRWPATLSRRHLLRLALCLPYAALAAWIGVRGVSSPVAADLEHQARPLALGSNNLGFLAHAYPPVPVALARIIPSAASLAIVGAFCAGGVLHLCWERLVRAQVPGWLIAVLLLGLGGAPIFWFNATENIVGFLGLACFAVAMAGVLDFMFSARTSGGFAAGLSLGLAVLCDPSALVYAASLMLAAPFLAWERFRKERYTQRSTLAVIAFPTIALVGAWSFLEWRFTGAVWHPLSVAPEAFHFPHGVLSGLSRSASRVGWEILCCPVFIVSAVFVLFRRPIAFVGFLAVPLDLTIAAWLGLHPATGQGLVLLNLLGVLAVPSRPGRGQSLTLAVAAAAGIAASLFLADGFGVWPFLRAVGL